MSALDRVREQFVAEARDLLGELEAALLELETSPAHTDAVDRAFRAMHTLKGSGAMAGLDDLAAFTHELESTFDRVRNGELVITPALITVALEAADHLGREVEGVDPDEMLRARDAELLDRLAEVVGRPAPDGPKARAVAPPPTSAESPTRFHLHFRPGGYLAPFGLDPVSLVDEVAFVGASQVEARWDLPTRLAELRPDALHVTWDVHVTTTQDEKALADIFIFVPDEAAPTIEVAELPALEPPSRPAEAPSPPAPPVRLPELSKPKTVPSVRVPASKLDRLFDLVGELVIAQARLNRVAGHSGSDALVGLSEELAHLTNDLRDSAMEIRMLPVGSTFGRFRRLVRDLGQQLGKRVELVTSGDDVELDKNVIDRLNDPLIHLIRNGIDHGIESEGDRRAAGKEPTGRLAIRAEHVSGSVVIEIEDDGRGLDLDRLYRKGVERGIFTEGARPSDAEIREVIFAAGFSTARAVTGVSGRGVGMDVVRTAISDLRGRIEVESVSGQGSCFRITLPLTLAIIDGLLFELDDAKYVVPLSIVEECVEVRADRGRTEADRGIIDVRGELVPYLRLRSWFGSESERPEVERVVIVKVRDERFGFVVDRVIGQHQTVVKALARMFHGIPELSGSTILGDGTVALILDVGLLVDALRAVRPAARPAVEPAPSEARGGAP